MNPLIAGTDPRRNGTALSVNVNKIALLRNTRHLNLPDVCRAAMLCLEAGADGITVHPRPDARHIRVDDVHVLAALMKRWPDAEFNIEGNPFQNLMDIVREHRPQQCTFVPDGESQFTSDHGWDLTTDGDRLRPLIDEAHALGIRVSLFMDADPAVMALARTVGADRVELYTEPYAAAHSGGVAAELKQSLATFAAAAASAQAQGLGVNAGHDLNRDNLAAFLAGVPGVLEVSIGHALIAEALERGLPETVRDYLRIARAAGVVPTAAAAAVPAAVPAADATAVKPPLDWSRTGAGPVR
ncbi:MAG: pyridoxine 5'-phosphate synthase [Pseudomonadota bacterium]|nr:pyridoxine 5'-phosphate synthase [Pseudomonadota bacterium]